MTGAGRDGPDDERLRQDAIAWLTRLQSGANPADHQAFEDWYSADPRHADAFDSVQTSWDRMGLAGATLAASGNRPAGRGAAMPARRLLRWPMAVAAGLGVLLVVTAGLGIHHHAGTKDQPPRQDLVSRVGEIRTVTLADRSRVTLDTTSAVTVEFGAKERRVLLGEGRARFEVAHDPARLFVVQAGTHLVIAHGTIFDVDLRGGAMRVSLLRGSIEVRRQAPDAPQAGPGQMLRPGQQLSFASDGAQSAPQVTGTGDRDWPSGMLSFTNRPVREIVAEANRYNGRHILLADPQLAELRFTVTAPIRDSEGLAHLLAASLHLALNRDAQGNFLLSRPIVKK